MHKTCNVIRLYDLYEVYYNGTYVGVCRNRECATKLLKALKASPNKKPSEVINELKYKVGDV